MPAVRTVHIGRRPVHDRALEVVAYELRADGADPVAAARELVLAGMVDLGLDRLASGRDLVAHLPDRLLRDGALGGLPLERVVLDMGPTTVVDDQLEGLLGSMCADGLRLRVADPVAHPHLAGLAELADVVRVDVGALSPDERRRRLALLRRGDRAVLASGVDDHALHADALAAGYDLFTGHVLSVPNVVAGRRLAPDRTSLLQLVALLADPAARVDDLEAVVATSPALSYQLLRYVNSAFVGLRHEVDSVRRAIVLVGPSVLRQLSGLLLTDTASDGPLEATRIALARARTCAALGAALGDDRPAHHTVGLLSAVDLLTGVALEVALEGLPLTDELVDALLHHEGRLGRILQAVRLYERCDWDDPVLTSFDPGLLAESWLSGIAWADEVLDRADRVGT